MSAEISRQFASEGTPIRVLIVDDSAVARAALSGIVAADTRCTVAGTASDTRRALDFLTTTGVDVVLLDLEMPGVGGLEALPDLIAAAAGARILVVSSACDSGASATVQALALGAADTLVKPAAGGLAGRFASVLIDRIVHLAERPAPSRVVPAPQTAWRDDFDVIAIGASTGGIHALGAVLTALPAEVRQPIVVTQHLPAAFTEYFAGQLATIAGRPCRVAEDRMRLLHGEIYVAPGDAHIQAVALPGGQAALRLSRTPSVTGCLPSVDPMFASLASVYGRRMLAIVLTGMGRDGSLGAAAVRAAGGRIIVQDAESSVVWGMPGAIANAGLADAIMSPEAIGTAIAGRRRVAA